MVIIIVVFIFFLAFGAYLKIKLRKLHAISTLVFDLMQVPAASSTNTDNVQVDINKDESRTDLINFNTLSSVLNKMNNLSQFENKLSLIDPQFNRESAIQANSGKVLGNLTTKPTAVLQSMQPQHLMVLRSHKTDKNVNV